MSGARGGLILIPIPILILILVVVPLLAGCVGGAPPPATTPAPDAFVPPTRGDYPASAPTACPVGAARATTYRFAVDVVEAPPQGRENAAEVVPDPERPRRPSFEWTWRNVEAGERPDRIARAAAFELHREPDGRYAVCARVDVAAASEEQAPAAAPLAHRVVAVPREDLPLGDYVFVVNWVVGCPSCGGTVRGSASATSDVG